MREIPTRRVVWVCLSFSGAIFAALYLLPMTALPWAALCCGLLGALGRCFRGKTRLCLRLAAFGAALGFLCYWGQERFIRLPAENRVGEQQLVSARITDWPEIYDDSAYVTVRLTEPGFPRVRCRVASYVPGELDGFSPGDEIGVELRFSSARVRNGQEIDNYAAQGIFLRAVCTEEPEYTGRWKGSFLYLPRRLGHAVQGLTQKLFPADTASFVSALLTGQKGALYRDGDRYYRLQEAGLAHVVAVSGMHISLLMGFFFLLLGRRRRVCVAGMVLLVFFSAMTGFTPSVIRAAFLFFCLLLAFLTDREEDDITALSLVLAVVLLCNPAAAGSISLQLSYASMAGIWLVSGRMYAALIGRIDASRWGRGVLRWASYVIAGIFSCGMGAMLFTAPLSAAHFGMISTVSPLSSLLCQWAVSTVYLGGGAAVALGALFPPAGKALAWILAWGVRYIYAVAGLLRRLPCALVYTSHPLFAAWLVYVYVMLLTMWLSGRKSGSYRPVAPLCLALISLYLCAFAVRLSWREELSVTALDVGQGECMLLQSGERCVVVDCGGSPITHDAGEIAVNYLGGRQRRHIDALILTHLHSDHANGAERLLRQCAVDTLYLPAEADRDGYLPGILAAARSEGTAVEYVGEDLELHAGEMVCTIFAPQLPGGENENCLCVLATQGEFDVLITGDSPAEAEELLISRHALPDIEVLAVGHHGSRSSTCRRLLEAARPDAAVISVGYNTYGHPAPEVLERLGDYNIAVYRTDEAGHITLRAPGG